MDEQQEIERHKAVLRQHATSRRAEVSGTVARAIDAAIYERLVALPEIMGSTRIFVFISVRQEIDTRRLIDYLVANGKTVLIPRVTAPRTMVATQFPGWAALTLGALKIPHASGAAFDGEIDIALVPGLCFTQAGARLGYGGGYYDRWLATQPSTHRIGVCREEDLLPSLPSAPYDEFVDRLVTERRSLEIGRRRVF